MMLNRLHILTNDKNYIRQIGCFYLSLFEILLSPFPWLESLCNKHCVIAKQRFFQPKVYQNQIAANFWSNFILIILALHLFRFADLFELKHTNDLFKFQIETYIIKFYLLSCKIEIMTSYHNLDDFRLSTNSDWNKFWLASDCVGLGNLKTETMTLSCKFDLEEWRN